MKAKVEPPNPPYLRAIVTFQNETCKDMYTKEKCENPLLEESSRPGAAVLEHVGEMLGSNWPSGGSATV